MVRLIDVVRSFGNAGAVANARTVIDERRRDEWVVRSLARRVAAVAPVVPADEERYTRTG
ncbi:MAG: hypothetical protein H0W25_11160 [Acidimicrobiia bacterium]|nr:hypothetical protein [Acidimicrobiia bacterium]